jgi:hypothetical protein
MGFRKTACHSNDHRSYPEDFRSPTGDWAFFRAPQRDWPVGILPLGYLNTASAGSPRRRRRKPTLIFSVRRLARKHWIQMICLLSHSTGCCMSVYSATIRFLQRGNFLSEPPLRADGGTPFFSKAHCVRSVRNGRKQPVYGKSRECHKSCDGEGMIC